MIYMIYLQYRSIWSIFWRIYIIIRPYMCNFIFLFFKCILYCFQYLFFTCLAAFGILVPWPGIEPTPPALAAWSLNYCTAKEVSICNFNNKQSHTNISRNVSSGYLEVGHKSWRGEINPFIQDNSLYKCIFLQCFQGLRGTCTLL